MKAKLKHLFDEYYGQLCSLANYYIADRQEAESVVQQVFLNVWEKRSELLESDKDLKFYLFKSVKNRSLSELSRNREEELDSNIEYQADLQDELYAKDLQEKIEILINQLPPKRKYIFKRSRFDGLSHKEIAEELDISVKTVEKQISAALKFLRFKIYDPNSQ